jgi:hypothetical protein
MVSFLATAMAAFTLAAGDPQCSASGIPQMPPAVLLMKENQFREGLMASDRVRLDDVLPRDAKGRIAACTASAGADCDSAAYLPALRSTGLMPAFLASLCGGVAD